MDVYFFNTTGMYFISLQVTIKTNLLAELKHQALSQCLRGCGLLEQEGKQKKLQDFRRKSIESGYIMFCLFG